MPKPPLTPLPAHAAAVVQRHPGGAAEGVAHEVLDGHVGGEGGAVVDVGGLAVGAVGAADVVVVAAQHHRAGQTTARDGVVEGLGDAHAAFGIGVQDARLGTDDQLVGLGASDPLDVVGHLLADLRRRLGHHRLQDLTRDGVRRVEVGGIPAGADPTERAEAIIEAHRPHDVLHVARIAEGLAVLGHDVGAGPGALQQEGVAVIEEVGAALGVAVDGRGVAAQAFLDVDLELVGVLGHHLLGLLEGEAGRVVAARPGVVQGGLVGAEVDVDAGGVEVFPDVDDVAEVGEADGLLGVHGGADLVGEFGDVLHDVVHPALLVALPGGCGVDFGGDGDHAGDVARLGLGAGHAAEARRDKQLAGEGRVLRVEAPSGIQDRDGRAVDDALRADVHVRSGGHLAVLADAEGVHAFVVVATAVVRNDHAIGHHHARRAGVEGRGRAGGRCT